MSITPDVSNVYPSELVTTHVAVNEVNPKSEEVYTALLEGEGDDVGSLVMSCVVVYVEPAESVVTSMIAEVVSREPSELVVVHVVVYEERSVADWEALVSDVSGVIAELSCRKESVEAPEEAWEGFSEDTPDEIPEET